MRLVYLDQNKWIDLARAVKKPARHPDLHALLVKLAPDLEAGRLALPLSSTNVYETFKINDPDRRHDLAVVQVTLSGGLVVRGRHARLEVEVGQFLRAAYGLPPMMLEPRWFLSDVFLEAFADVSDPRIAPHIPAAIAEAIKRNPPGALYDYLLGSPDATRKEAIAQYSAGAADLKCRIEARRQAHADQSPSMRSRIYNASLMIEEMDLLRDIAQRAGVDCTSITDIGAKLAKQLMHDVPVYDVERELTLRLESQTRPVEENDFRDMQAFCAAIPYVDLIIGEKQFVNLARQSGLHDRYQTRLSTNLLDLAE